MHTTGPPPHAASTVCSERQLGPIIGPSLHPCAHTTGRIHSVTVVDIPPQPASRGPGTRPLPQLQLFTDASTKGWGTHLTSHQTSGKWSSLQRSLHTNNLELLSVHLALQHFLPLVISKVVIVMTDNTTVVDQVKNQGDTHSQSLHRQTVLLEWVDSRRITLTPRHIPGHLNVVADHLSQRHQIIISEWTLCHQVLHHMWCLWGQPHVNLFVTSETTRLPTYISPIPDPAAWRSNLSFLWTDLWVYMFPPFSLIPEVLQRIQMSNYQAILIAPAWPSQPWFPHLLSLLGNHPRCLPLPSGCSYANRSPRSFTQTLNASVCTPGSYQVSPRLTQLLLASGSPHCLVTPTLHTVSLRQQIVYLHRVA